MSRLKKYFDNKKNKMKKKSHRKEFPVKGRDWEREKQQKGFVTIRDLGDETEQ